VQAEHHRAELDELAGEDHSARAEVEHGLALERDGLLAGVPELDPAAGEAHRGRLGQQGLEPGGLGGVVHQHARLIDGARGVFAGEAEAEPVDQRLGVGRVHPDPAAPGHFQPVRLGRPVGAGADDRVGLVRAGRVQVDAAHDGDGGLDVGGRGVPLVVAGVVPDVRAGGLGLGVPVGRRRQQRFAFGVGRVLGLGVPGRPRFRRSILNGRPGCAQVGAVAVRAGRSILNTGVQVGVDGAG
jgi:hypothetical protein